MLLKIRNFLFVNNSISQTLAKNTFWLSVGEIISRLLKMILVVYAARILGVAGWGIFSYAISIASLLYIFSDFGLENVVTREIAKSSDEKLHYFSTAFFIRSILLALCLLVIFFITFFIIHTTEIREILFPIALMLAFDSLRNLTLAISRALEKMEQEAYIRSLTSFLVVGLGLATLIYIPSIKNLAYAYLLGSFAGLIISLYILRTYIAYIPEYFSKKLIGPIMKIAWPFCIFWVTATIMVYTDIIMLGWWKTPTDLGLYSAARRLVQFLLVIPNLIAFTTLPLFSKLVTESREKLRETFEKTLSFTLLLGLPIVVGGILLGKDIVLVVFGESYIDSVLVFQIFLGMLVTMFPSIIVNNFIFTHNMQRKFVWCTIGGALLNILLNFVLIPKFGIYGAAVATAFSSVALTIIIWYIAKKINYFKVLPYIKKIVLATIIMGVTTFSGRQLGLNLFLNIGLSAIVFGYTLYLLKESLFKELEKILQTKKII